MNSQWTAALANAVRPNREAAKASNVQKGLFSLRERTCVASWNATLEPAVKRRAHVKASRVVLAICMLAMRKPVARRSARVRIAARKKQVVQISLAEQVC